LRTVAYTFVLMALALGMIWASAYASFFAAAFFFYGFFENELLSTSAYALGFILGVAVVGYYTVRGISLIRRNGPPPHFRGWRYSAALACALMVGFELVVVIASREPSRLILPPSPAGLFYVPVVLLAMAALSNTGSPTGTAG